MVPPRPPVALLETARPTGPGSARRWDDRPTGRPVIPAQRGPGGPRPVQRLAAPEAPVVAPGRVEAPARRRPGLNPDLARVALAGVLLFGALIASMSTPPPVADPPAPSGQHAASVTHRWTGRNAGAPAAVPSPWPSS
jgi:hypothetical protein